MRHAHAHRGEYALTTRDKRRVLLTCRCGRRAAVPLRQHRGFTSFGKPPGWEWEENLPDVQRRDTALFGRLRRRLARDA